MPQRFGGRETGRICLSWTDGSPDAETCWRTTYIQQLRRQAGDTEDAAIADLEEQKRILSAIARDPEVNPVARIGAVRTLQDHFPHDDDGPKPFTLQVREIYQGMRLRRGRETAPLPEPEEAEIVDVNCEPCSLGESEDE